MMKKQLLICLLIGMSACLNTVAQEIEIDCNGLANTGFSLLSYNDIKLYAKNYKDVHGSGNVEQTKAYYINSKVILFLDSFFKRNTDFFGFNVYMVTYPVYAARFQKSRRQALLYIAPVKNIRDSIADYSVLSIFFDSLGNQAMFSRDSLNKGIACLGSCDSSIMSWVRYNGSNTRLNIKPGGSQGQDIFLLSDNQETHRLNRARYFGGHGQQLSQKQTRGMFFKKETIMRMAQFINSPNNLYKFPMIGIYFMSYDYRNNNRPANKDQTTLGFVPMRLTNSGFYEPDICAYVNYWKAMPGITGLELKKVKTENHGELCPDDCPRNGYQ